MVVHRPQVFPLIIGFYTYYDPIKMSRRAEAEPLGRNSLEQDRKRMNRPEDPADEATLSAFADLLEALVDWRRVIDLQIDGKTIFRATVNFGMLMQPSSMAEIEIVHGFEDEPEPRDRRWDQEN